MKKSLFLLSSILISSPALAGEEPLYQPAPQWVAQHDLPTDAKGPPLLLYDDQRRLAEGVVTTYVDRAFRVDNPQMLTALGTLQAAWLPDQGDLIIHKAQIVRGGEIIDLLAQGAKFDVLRREQQLEQRTLTGEVTATMTVPGLRVGDILRASYTTTVADKTLGKEMQTVVPLLSAPFDAKSASVELSWPIGSGITWAATREVELPSPTERAGFQTVKLALPLPKPDDMPADAPARYQMPAFLQAGSYADWHEVSQTMAPLYLTDGSIEPGSPLALEVAKIAAASESNADRMIAALRLVQDEVAYLAIGMDGGNYTPQSPAETWEKRFGDCKAKTLLLLAILHEMGISAEAALVSSVAGDAIPAMLPMPAVFDHVIVHATADGKEYWLDGTNSGANMATLDSVPPFRNALPVRAEGADLVAMTPRQGRQFDNSVKIVYDNRAGLDLPTLFEGEWEVAGPMAATFHALIDQVGEDQMKDMIAEFVVSAIGASQVYEGSMTFDAQSNSAKVAAKGLMTSLWKWDHGLGERPLNLLTTNFEFKPDRSRKAWNDIPVEVPGPFARKNDVTILLPDTTGAFTLEGKATLNEDIAGTHLERNATIEGNRFQVTDSSSSNGGELPVDQAIAERSRASRLGSLALKLKAPREIARRFELAGKKDRSALAPIESAYARLIADDPEDADNFRNRARFRAGTYDRQGALADWNKVIELEPTARDYWSRASVLTDLGRLEEGLSDAESASELEPSVDAAIFEAQMLRQLDRADEAAALLEGMSGDADENVSIADELSQVYAQQGRKEDGLRQLEDLALRRPGDFSLLNLECWYRGTWNVRLDDIAEVCTKAVERSSWSPPALDSRAMAYFRLGRHQEALADLEAALAASPELTPSLLMRGVVRRAMGDANGKADIADALARDPSLKPTYARYGIELN